MASVERISGTAMLAFPGMKGLLTAELSERFGYGKVTESAAEGGCVWHGDLLYCPDFTADAERAPYWARCCMSEPFLVRFKSISDAAGALKSVQRNWAPYQHKLFRRAALIQEKLPYINMKARKFPAEIPGTPMGLYTLIDESTMLASAVTSSPLPAGAVRFVEDHDNPPSRAYLKLQESLSLYHTFFGADFPKEGDACFDAGASPGGWTWVMRQLGAEVLAVDRAALAPPLMRDAHVRFMAHDAFTLRPDEVCMMLRRDRLDWLLSDVICYPERLFEWVTMWLESGRARNIICTIKMQGAANWPLLADFARIQDSKIVHLNYNKHELTVMIRRP